MHFDSIVHWSFIIINTFAILSLQIKQLWQLLGYDLYYSLMH